jgi:hypothetical protein
MSVGPSEQEDGRIERGLTYALVLTAAKTRARERPAPAASRHHARRHGIRPRRTTRRREMSRIASTLASRAIDREKRGPRDAAISQAPTHDRPAQHYQ